eukprot:864603-Amphidinium_carterae.1
MLDQNLLGGPIPQRLLGSSKQASKFVGARASECPNCQQGQHATCLTRKTVSTYFVQYDCVNILQRSLRAFCHRGSSVRVKPSFECCLGIKYRRSCRF